MELVVMNIPAGCSVCRVAKTDSIDFPKNVNSFSVEFTALLEAAWMGKQLMKDTATQISNKKRKAIVLATGDEQSHLTPPFYSIKN